MFQTTGGDLEGGVPVGMDSARTEPHPPGLPTARPPTEIARGKLSKLVRFGPELGQWLAALLGSDSKPFKTRPSPMAGSALNIMRAASLMQGAPAERKLLRTSWPALS